MWFIGLIAGAIMGGMFGSFQAALFGGVLGVVAALFYNASQRNLAQFEKRIAALEKNISELHAQLGSPARKTASAAPDAPRADAPVIKPGIPATDALARPPATAPQPRPAPATASYPARATVPAQAGNAPAPDAPRAAPAPTGIQNEWLRKLLSGNILAKIGVVILFFGVASALKLAVDMGLFPISVRLMLGGLAAIGMSIFGYNRAQVPAYRMFGQALQGGGMAIQYLLVYFMLERYHMLSTTPAFILFTLIGVSCILLAARQDARVLAVLGISGAFLSPVMVANSGGSEAILFSYFLLLNSFIITVNWFKGWRELNLSGFIFTLVIGMNWAYRTYRPEDFITSETFLILFSLLYSATPVLFNLFKAPGRLSWGDGMLLYGTPLAAAFLQNQMLRGQDMTLAWNACAAGSYYLLLWWPIHHRPNAETVWLEKSLLAIAIGFFTLAIPLAFDAQLTSAFWTLEGFGVLYLGVQQDRFLARLSGGALQFLAGFYFLFHLDELGHALPIVNDVYVGSLIVVIAAISSALLLHRSENKDNRQVALLFLYWGLLWWFAAGWNEIEKFAAYFYQMAYALGLCMASFAFLEWLGTRRAWIAMRQPPLLLLPMAVLAACQGYIEHGHALYNVMALLLPLALVVHYWLLYRHDRDETPALRMPRHAVSYWLLLALAGSELAWAGGQLAPGVSLWPLLAWGGAGAAGLLLTLRGLLQTHWPFGSYRTSYLTALQYPVALLLTLWMAFSNLSHSGAGSGLPYLPLLNPFDLMQLLAMYALWRWARTEGNEEILPALPILYSTAFLWISAEAARLTFHWGGVPFESSALFASAMLQASLSLLWTTIAMGLMIYATQQAIRQLWFTGFALLAVVGAKLLMVDLSNKGTVTWTLSLIGIAVLVIAASYFSPAPPKGESVLQ